MPLGQSIVRPLALRAPIEFERIEQEQPGTSFRFEEEESYKEQYLIDIDFKDIYLNLIQNSRCDDEIDYFVKEGLLYKGNALCATRRKSATHRTTTDVGGIVLDWWCCEERMREDSA